MRTKPTYTWPISHEPATGCCKRAEAQVRRVVKGTQKVSKKSTELMGRETNPKKKYVKQSYTKDDASRLLSLALQKLG